ncbi:MAG TPA: ATP-binding protein, partial [Flavisolibacter sp.]|nr:ATP-binding protein [Flavisolibacter sp.]
MELLERNEFLQLLRNGFRKTLSGEGHCFFVMGEAGIGKSSLVRSFLKEVEGKCQVVTALCDSLFTPRPLGILYDFAPQIDPTLTGKMGSTTLRAELFTDVAQALTRYNEPVVLVIEDTHWADEASLDFIKFFARRISATGCMFILTYR